MKKVSVVIPCYNMGAYIEDALSSLGSQTYTDYEVIIVDDGSTEPETLAKLKDIQAKYPQYQVLHKKNSGLAGARNYGIERSQGEYIICLDADDMLKPTYLEETVAVLEADTSKKYGFVTTWLQEFGVRKDVWKTGEFNEARLLMNNQVHAGSLFRKSVWTEVGGYKKMKIGGYEDWNLWLSIVEKGYQWSVIEDTLFMYRIRENSMLASARSAHVEIYRELYELHPKLFERHTEDLILENAKELKSLRDYIAEERKLLGDRDEEIKELRQQNDDLGKKIFEVGNDLNDLRHSRLVGKAIATRSAAGTVRHGIKKLSPKRIVHKVRVVGAPYVHPIARTATKKTYRLARDKTAGLRTKTEWVRNLTWVDKPLVSVVIPYFDKADTLHETLDSLMLQTFQNFETIIIDDGSKVPFDEANIIKTYGKQLRLQIKHQENQGVAMARNNGIALAEGRYVVCLDPDDLLEPTFIEKGVIILETQPEAALVTTYVEAFGVRNDIEIKAQYDPINLFEDNMVITAALFKKESWEKVGGYKSNLGYEDWEYWINLAEHGAWGKLIPETLFRYRTAAQSRYVEDKNKHWNILQQIRMLHPQYRKNIRRLLKRGRYVKQQLDRATAFVNLRSAALYAPNQKNKEHVLLALPWMTFGGAETLIINFCQELKDDFQISFVTGLESDHEWEYRFKELTQNIYHLPNLFGDQKDLYVEFISNYVESRDIHILHIIHTDFMFELLPEIKRRHPDLKVILTLFNDRATHFEKSLDYEAYIDAFSSDNQSVAKHYQRVLKEPKAISVIPNGINCYDVYNPALFDRKKMRSELGIRPNDLAMFFIGRISPEKNPDVFVAVAKKLIVDKNLTNLKFFVIGDGVMRQEVEAEMNAIDSENLVYLGYKKEVANYLSAADIFILPSSIEGFPLSILEAMGMKVAIVASDVGAVSEIVETGKEGYVVTPGSVDEIAAAVEALQKDRQLLDDMKDNARKKIDGKFSNTLLGQNYKKLYKEL